jgi:glycosyltransferase involved in cell wall biosynthesis
MMEDEVSVIPSGQRPRVLHVVPALFGADGLIGGGERYALELSRAMAARVPTTLLSFGATAGRRRIGALDVEIIRNWLPGGRFTVDPVNLGMLRRLAEADVIHYHQTNTMMSSVALLYARATRTPIYTTNLGGGGIALHHLIDVSHWYAGHLHCSEFSRNAFGQRTLASARVILGGVDYEKFAPDSTVERTGEALFVGRLLPHKGINYLIEAVDANTQLTLIGRRWWRRQERFYQLLQTLAAGKRVAFLEQCDDGDLIAAYRRALCVVLPSVPTTVFGERYTVPELLGQTLLEGMACGTPAICTNVGGMPEVVEDGITGFVVPPNDPAALGEKIAWLQRHPAEASEMGRAARRRVVEHFSWQRVVDRCFDAYGVTADIASTA